MFFSFLESSSAKLLLVLLFSGIVLSVSLRHHIFLLFSSMAVLPLFDISVPLPLGEMTFAIEKVLPFIFLAVWFFLPRKRKFALFGKNDLDVIMWFGVLLLFGFLSLAAGNLRDLTSWLSWAEIGAHFIVFFVSIDIIGNRPRARELLKFLPVILGLVLLLMACQYAIYAFEPNWGLTVARYISINYPLPRVEATSSLGPKFAPVFAAFAHPNFFGAYLLLFWFIIFLPNKPAKRPMASLILKMGMIAALITTRSKGATIGIGGALFLVLFFWFIARGRFQIAAFVAIAIITTALVYFTYLLYERDTSVQIRLHVTQIALKSVAEKPLLGYGPGSFSSAFKDLETRQFKRDNGPTSRVSSAESSHNSYVRLLVENGLLGLFALFGLLSALIRHGLKGLGLSRFSNPPPHIGLTLGILAFAIQAATDDTFAMSKLTFMFWILVALILHLTPQNQVDQYSDPASEFDETLPETAEV